MPFVKLTLIGCAPCLVPPVVPPHHPVLSGATRGTPGRERVADLGMGQDESSSVGRAARGGPSCAGSGWQYGRSALTRGLPRHPQLDPVIWSVNQILLRAQVPFGRLDRRMAQEQLNLLQLPTGGATQFRRRAATIMRRDARDASSLGVWQEHLSDHLFGKDLALHLVGSIDRSEKVSVCDAGPNRPGINRHFHPNWHRHGSHAPVLLEQVHDAPPAITLLDVAHRKRRHF